MSCTSSRTLMLVLIFGLGLVGCADEVYVTFTEVGFSERLRADLDPLDARQQTVTPEVFSDGGADGSELVSPLVPKEIPPESLRSFRTADVLWTAGQAVSLSWEVLVFEPLFNGQRPTLTDAPYGGTDTGRPTKRLTANNRGVVQPRSREFLVWDGNVLASDTHPGVFARDFVGVALVRCLDGPARRDPGNPPTGLDEQCDSRTLLTPGVCAPVDHERSLFPMTVIGCTTPAAVDTTYRLEVVDPGDPRRTSADVRPGTRHHPLEIRPHIKVVGSDRVLSRPLRFGLEECTMRTATPEMDAACDQLHLDALLDWRTCRGEIERDPARPPRCVKFPPSSSNEGNYARGYSSLRSEWTFNVADAAGRWTENFTNRVQVTQVKVRLRRWNGTTRYAKADEIRFLHAGAWRCLPRPEGDDGEAVFDMAACVPPDTYVSPAWSARDFSQLLDWRLTFTVLARDVVVGYAVPSPRPIDPSTGPRATIPLTAEGVLMADLPVLASDEAFLEFRLALRR